MIMIWPLAIIECYQPRWSSTYYQTFNEHEKFIRPFFADTEGLSRFGSWCYEPVLQLDKGWFSGSSFAAWNFSTMPFFGKWQSFITAGQNTISDFKTVLSDTTIAVRPSGNKVDLFQADIILLLNWTELQIEVTERPIFTHLLNCKAGFSSAEQFLQGQFYC